MCRTCGQVAFAVLPQATGRATVKLCFRDATGQGRGCLSVHYIVLQPLQSLLGRFGRFQSSQAWLPASSQDPFGRGSSVMPWDRLAGSHVLHDPRCACAVVRGRAAGMVACVCMPAWVGRPSKPAEWRSAVAQGLCACVMMACVCLIELPTGMATVLCNPAGACRAFVVGLSDEAGAGANVGLAIKVRHAPVLAELARVDEYVQQTLCGTKPGLPHSASLQVCLEVVDTCWHAMALLRTIARALPGGSANRLWTCSSGVHSCPDR